MILVDAGRASKRREKGRRPHLIATLDQEGAELAPILTLRCATLLVCSRVSCACTRDPQKTIKFREPFLQQISNNAASQDTPANCSVASSPTSYQSRCRSTLQHAQRARSQPSHLRLSEIDFFLFLFPRTLGKVIWEPVAETLV